MVSKDEPILLIPYSYGCIITLEAVALLEKDGYTAEVILIDGSADMFKIATKQQIGEPDDLKLFETNILCAMMSQFTKIEEVAKRRVCTSFRKRKFFLTQLFSF